MRRAGVVLALCAGACANDGQFPCSSSGQCLHGGSAGRCEATGFCSFADPACASMRRYGTYAPADLADQCVLPPDASSPDARRVVTVKLAPAADTWIASDQMGNNFGATGDLQANGALTHVALLRFDLSNIPGGSQVMSATFSINTTGSGGLGQGSTQIFRLLEPWTEGTHSGGAGVANWTQRTSAAAWTAAGAGPGSRDTTALAELVPSANDTRYDVALPAAAVQAWLDTPASNNGIILVDKNAGTQGAIFVSRDSSPSSKRPALTVVYLAP